MKIVTFREMQEAELQILDELDGICKKTGLRYSLVGGSLLGAVRHKGFIPWDDDVDVGMPRPDYLKLIDIFEDCCSCKNLFLQTGAEHGGEERPFLKICDRNITIKSDLVRSAEYLGIDIFPIDGLSDDEAQRKKDLSRAQRLRRIIVHSGADLSSLEKWKGIKSFFVKLFHMYAKLYGKERATRELIALSQSYEFEHQEFCGIIAWATYGKGEGYPKSGFDNMAELEFERRSYPAINCWDYYLRNLYGDYMQLPPESQRKTHEMLAFQEEIEL